MKTFLAIGAAIMAASMAAPGAFAQATTRTQVIRTNTPYLGIATRDIDSDSAKKFNLKEVRGVEITSVDENTPAAKAGLKDGDVVLDYNGQPVEGGAQLARLVRETPIGRQVKIGVWRNGSMQTVTATTEERKGPVIINGTGDTWTMPDLRGLEELRNFRMPEINVPNFSITYQSPRLGIMGEPLSSQDQLAEFFGVKDGVLVKSVTHNSAAEKAGIKAGDVIVKIEDEKVSNSADITRAMRDARSKKTVTVVVVRQKKEMPLTVTIEAAAAAGRPVRAGGVYIAPGQISVDWNGPVVHHGATIVYQ